MAEAKIALHALNAGLVLDRSVFIGQTVSEMQAIIDSIRNMKSHVTVIENGAAFFTASNMLKLIKAGDEAYELIAEKANVVLRAEDVMAIKIAEAVKKAIEASMIPPIPPYPFAAVPAAWSLKHLTVSKGAKGWVHRLRVNPQGDGTTYTISLNQLRRIWAVAAPHWQLGSGPTQIPDIRAQGYTRLATIAGLSVAVGCQTIQRYELEQLALHLGWDFPTPVAK